MASTAIWSETISFRLVSAPVRPHTAIDEKDLHFHLPHTNDDSRIGYEKVQSGGKARSGRRDRHGVRVRARKGREVHVEPATEEQAAPSDVLAALRESVAQHVKSGGGGRRLEGLTKTELEEEAKRRHVKGCSRMKKDELVAALK